MSAFQRSLRSQSLTLAVCLEQRAAALGLELEVMDAG